MKNLKILKADMNMIWGVDLKAKNQTRKLRKKETHKKVKKERKRQENQEARIMTASSEQESD